MPSTKKESKPDTKNKPKAGANKKDLRKPGKSGAARAGLTIPPAQVMRLMRRHRLRARMGKMASVYMAALMEFAAEEIIETAIEQTLADKKKRVTPRHLKLAISKDSELHKLYANCIFHEGGVLPNLHPALFNKKKGQTQI